MIPALILILACQMAGEILVRLAGLPLPGPVMGMAVMLIGLILIPRLAALIRPVAQTILGNLALLLVPAGVGAADQIADLGGDFWPVVIALVASLLLSMATAAAVFSLVAKWMGNRE